MAEHRVAGDDPPPKGQILEQFEGGLVLIGLGVDPHLPQHAAGPLVHRREQVEQRTRPGMRVFDVGTGSGILALAAAKLGAASVYCIDNSSVAVESATANAAVNALSDRITVVLGVLDAGEAARMAGQFDLVLANIIARVIGSIAPQLAQVIAPGGLLIASGIIEERRHEAEQPLLAAGLTLVDQLMIDDWVALIMRK